MTNCDYVRIESPGKTLIGDSCGVREDVFEQQKDLLIVIPVQVKTQLLQTFLALLLLMAGLASRPCEVIFF